jgi:Domain of unknown function (DUF6378)
MPLQWVSMENFPSPKPSGTTSESKPETTTETPAPDSPESVNQEAHRIIHGPRRNTAGHPRDNFARVAAGWSVILGTELTSKQVALCMIWHKVCREVNAEDRDNIVDIAGYAGTYEMLDSPDI